MDRLHQDREKFGREIRQSLGKGLRGVYDDFAVRPLSPVLLALFRRLELSESAASAAASSHKEHHSRNRGR
jgi:hypothetical protein